MTAPGTLHGSKGYLLAFAPAAKGWMAALGAAAIAFPMFSWLKPIGILVGSLRPSEPEAFCCKFRWVICH